MHLMGFRNTVCVVLLLVAALTAVQAQRRPGASNSSASNSILIRILRAEDERRWDDNLKSLLSAKDAKVRKRAALAAGRIGDERAVPALSDMLKSDPDAEVRQMAAFAIGEIESYAGADTLYRILGDTSVPRAISARAVEALGKIAAALPESDKEHKQEIGKAILGVLSFEADPRVSTDRLTALLGLTAALRARPDGAGPVVVKFLKSLDPRIVADALNTMARLRLKDNNEEVRGLLKHADPIVRANAARVIGAAEDKGGFEALLDRALHDQDLRVRVSAIRALGSLKDERAAQPLLERAFSLKEQMGRELKTLIRSEQSEPNTQQNEWLEIVSALGNLLRGKPGAAEIQGSGGIAWNERIIAPEVTIAFAKMNPRDFTLRETNPFLRPNQRFPQVFFSSWRRASAVAQGLGIIATLKAEEVDGDPSELKIQAQKTLRLLLSDQRLAAMAVPDVLTAYVSLKPADSSSLLRSHLQHQDVIVRSTSAEQLGNLPPDQTNTRALIAALPRALRDRDLNDAALAILDALGKQKSAAANEAIKTALNSSDHLIRRRAVALLKANGAGDFSNRIGYVQTRNTEADYRRAIARIGKKVTATVMTTKGSFTIEFLPEDAPLTVDNFVMLARRGYFNGQTVPRVVPNFVVQTGDPRGDQNGGPGYSIRCEINEAPYGRAAVGMALSGKDTGGSQWFVTHSPQPHLDGGYTVFGRVVSGMDVVDRIARGDTIRRVFVNER